MNKIKISPSTRKNKKFMAVDSCKRTVHFGAKNYSDFTIHKDKERRARYFARHYAIKNISDADISKIR
jgi:hypothetical protein